MCGILRIPHDFDSPNTDMIYSALPFYPSPFSMGVCLYLLQFLLTAVINSGNNSKPSDNAFFANRVKV